MALIPTPVTIENLIDETSDINTINDGVEAQVDQPRTRAFDIITVQVIDDPFVPDASEEGQECYWNQRQTTGEWVRTQTSSKYGNAKLAEYTGAIETAGTIIDWVIVPRELVPS